MLLWCFSGFSFLLVLGKTWTSRNYLLLSFFFFPFSISYWSSQEYGLPGISGWERASFWNVKWQASPIPISRGISWPVLQTLRSWTISAILNSKKRSDKTTNLSWHVIVTHLIYLGVRRPTSNVTNGSGPASGPAGGLAAPPAPSPFASPSPIRRSPSFSQGDDEDIGGKRRAVRLKKDKFYKKRFEK